MRLLFDDHLFDLGSDGRLIVPRPGLSHQSSEGEQEPGESGGRCERHDAKPTALTFGVQESAP